MSKGELLDIQAIVEDIRRRHEIVCEQGKAMMDEIIGSATSAAEREFGVYQAEKIQSIFYDSVDEFYLDYSPKTYLHRKFGLRDLLSIKIGSNGMVESIHDNYLEDYIDRDAMHENRSGGKNLFDLVFMQGYHGGASDIASSKTDVWGRHPATGIPYYRGGGFVRYPDNTRKWHRYGKWYKPASKSTPPYETFSDRLAAAEAGEMVDTYKRFIKKKSEEAMVEVREKGNKMLRDFANSIRQRYK